MNLYIEQNAAMVAGLAQHERPACDGIIMKLGDPSDVLAVTVRSNPLGEGWLLDTDLPGNRVVTWSGTLAEKLFEANPMTWMQPGQSAFTSFCDDIADQLQRHGRTLCFQPHARHVLSDGQSCVRFIRDRRDQPFEIAFSPTSILEPSMLPSLDDHLARAFEVVDAMAAANAMLVLHDVLMPESTGEDLSTPEPAPLGDGVLPRDLVRSLLERYLDGNQPIVLMPSRIEQQLEWLGVSRS